MNNLDVELRSIFFAPGAAGPEEKSVTWMAEFGEFGEFGDFKIPAICVELRDVAIAPMA